MEIRDLSVTDFLENAEKNGDVIIAIREGLSQYNSSLRPDPSAAPITLAVHDDRRELIAGLSGRTAYGWLRIDILWVSEQNRGRGIGKRLIDFAEKIAIDRGCHGAHLDTYGFQAPAFYERLGYERFGELPRYPDDDVHGFYRKFFE